MTIFKLQHLEAHHKQAIFHLWNGEYPTRLRFNEAVDLDRYLSTLQAPHHFFAEQDHNIIGWAVSFARDEEQWFAIIISSEFHAQGIGKKLLEQVKQNHTALSGWVIDHNNDVRTTGEPYRSPLNFYLKQQFELCDGIRLETPQLSAVKIKWRA